jgi:ribosome biogenesis GTPase
MIEGGSELIYDVPGRLKHGAASALELPSIGDWVAITPRLQEGRATIEHVLERKSQLVRRAAGDRDDAQVIAANVDTTFIVTSLNQDFSERRIERYLAVVRAGNSNPVILLSKADLIDDLESAVQEVERLTRGAPVIAVSSKTELGFEAGLESVREYAREGQTIAVIGSSGVGKSTLVNLLVGTSIQKTQDVRGGDDKGRHTTTDRYLIRLPSGGLIIDTPGMREIQLWDAAEGVDETFEDIEALALRCKFTNCLHESEKGCAVRDALDSGEIDPARLDSFKKLRREATPNWERIKKDKQSLRSWLKSKEKK